MTSFFIFYTKIRHTTGCVILKFFYFIFFNFSAMTFLPIIAGVLLLTNPNIFLPEQLNFVYKVYQLRKNFTSTWFSFKGASSESSTTT